MTELKHAFRDFWKLIKNQKFKYLIHKSKPFSETALAFQIVVRCILFALFILKMCLELNWSPPVAVDN